MKSKNLAILSLLATLLLSSTFVSFVAADDEEPNLIATLDEPITDPPDSSDDSTISDDDVILYTTEDENSTRLADDTQAPTAEDASKAAEGNLIATQTGAGSDNTLLFAAIAAIFALTIGGAIGVVYYCKQTAKGKK